jgi:FKBP-type peptidyl-prolyl cis-trans isomerase 2
MSAPGFTRIGLAAVTTLVLFSSIHARADDKEVTKVVESGKQISIEYTLRLDDGTTADTNVGAEPLVFEYGSGRILPALEEAMVGMKVDETKEVKLSAEQGYGPVNPEAYQTVELDAIPEEARQVGVVLVAQGSDGRQRTVRVHEVNAENVVIDFNHPLAGKNLNFDIKIIEIE